MFLYIKSLTNDSDWLILLFEDNKDILITLKVVNAKTDIYLTAYLSVYFETISWFYFGF